MPFAARFRIAGLLCAAGVLSALPALAQDIKPGLWEMKQRPQFDGQRQAQMAQMQKQMAALPPEQRKQMETMMAQHGLSMDFAAGEVTLKACVTKEQADRALLPNRADGKCEHSTQRSGNTLMVTFRCANPTSEGTNEITLDGPDHYLTKSDVRMQRDGKTETMRATGEARWLGSDCGSIKPQTAKDAEGTRPPARHAVSAAPEDIGSLCDVAGLKVGHYTHPGVPTGCSVVLCEAGATAGIDVRGAAPGTRDTELLRPENTVQQVHAVMLTGGSAFGLAAADGAMRWLAEHGHGFAVGDVRVPIVPAAVLFDLWLHGADTAPDAAAGRAACEAATSAERGRGRLGAGAGATVGKLMGVDRAMKGGLGMASVRVGDVTLAAMVAVNAVGDVVDPAGRVIAGTRGADGQPRSTVQALLAGEPVGGALAGSATTIGVIATDARLTKAQATKLAQIAHDGLAIAIRPVHTVMDGDVMFALATGAARVDGDMTRLGAVAAEVVARAIVDAVRAAARQSRP